jgi:hypothetical protein
LAVKDNQPTLHAEIQAAFATAATPPARSTRLYTRVSKTLLGLFPIFGPQVE